MFSLRIATLQDRTTPVAAIQQQVESRQARNEVTVQLRIGWVAIILPFDPQAVGFEQREAEIVTRGAAAQVARGAEMLTELQQPGRLRALDAQRRRAMDLGRELQPCPDHCCYGEIEIDDVRPRTLQQLLQLGDVVLEKRRLGIVL